MTDISALSGGAAGGVTGQLDVRWIVEQIITAKQQPIRELETYETFYQAKRESFQELNTRVSAVESALYKINSSGFTGKSATLSSQDYLTATAATTASPGSYAVVVKQLAQAESYTADNVVSNPNAVDVFTAGDKQFTITPRDGSDAKTINAEGKSLNQLKDEINSLGLAVTASVIQYDTNDYRLVLTADDTGADEGFTISGDAALTTLGMDQKITNQDAQVSVNNPGIYISRNSNTITDVIGGVTLNLKDADITKTTTLTVTADSSALSEKIQTFVDAFNDAVDYLNEQFTYDEQKQRAGVLSGESAAVKIKNDLLSLASRRVSGIEASASYKTFALIGLELDRTGHLEIDDEKLDDAISNHMDAVQRLFKNVGTATNSEISYIGKTNNTVGGTYAVNITQAATQMYMEGTENIAANLAQDETLTITYNGNAYNVDLTSGWDQSEVVEAINTAMDDEDVPVYAQVTGGKLRIITDDYGSAENVAVTSDIAAAAGGTGIGATPTGVAGLDVQGTIGGNAATGSGRRLTGTAGNSNGLALYVSSTTTGDKGSVNFTRGPGETLRERMSELSFPYTGIIAKNIEALDNQLQNITDKIAAINRNLATEEDMLIAQYTKANEALAQMSYLQSSLSKSFS